jgi:hypothetical protein
MIKISDEQKALLASYGRSVLGAGVAVYASTGDLKAAANAFGRKAEEEQGA